MLKPILVVDDDPDIRQVLHDRLESFGYPVETAADGRVALEKLEHLTPRGIFLDIRMPGMDGLEVLGRIRDRHRTVPVVIITAVSAGDRVVSALAAGAQAYLLKPFEPSQIKQVAESWFGKPPESANDT
jgi:CheY-like chemotaxis protein